jgi:glucuronosyltransferase
MEKMPQKMKENILKTFAKFPDYNFIWKITPSEKTQKLSAQYKNVYAVEWIDQITALAHNKTRLFITHCGLNSVIETVWHGIFNYLKIRLY